MTRRVVAEGEIPGTGQTCVSAFPDDTSLRIDSFIEGPLGGRTIQTSVGSVQFQHDEGPRIYLALCQWHGSIRWRSVANRYTAPGKDIILISSI